MFAHTRTEKDGLLAQGSTLDACLLFAGLKKGLYTLRVEVARLE